AATAPAKMPSRAQDQVASCAPNSRCSVSDLRRNSSSQAVFSAVLCSVKPVLRALTGAACPTSEEAGYNDPGLSIMEHETIQADAPEIAPTMGNPARPNAAQREADRKQRREAILRSAIKLFSEKGYDGAAMAEIAAGAQLAVGTLYKFFQDKRDLYQA